MTARIRVAVVGAGGIADALHLPALRTLSEKVEVVAAVDVDRDRVRGFADRHGIANVYTDVDEMLAREQPDLVDVCTPPNSHAALAVSCLHAGAWVWCEKPPCASLAELDRIRAAEEASGQRCSFVFQWRFGSGAQHLRRLIDDATFGNPLLALCHTTWFRPPAYYEVPWRGRWSTEAGGPTTGHAIHAIDLMLWLLGEWRSVRATIGRLDRAIETEDVSLANVELDCGALANVVASVVSPREESYLRFDFQRATVELRHLYGYTNADWRFTLRPGEEDSRLRDAWDRLPSDEPSGHLAQLLALIESMRRDETPAAGTRDVRRTMEFLTALYKSAMTGETVRHGTITETDAFYHALHGNHPEWAGVPS